MHNIELFHSHPEENPVLTPQMLIRYRMEKRKQNLPDFPRACILGFFPSLYPMIKQMYITKTIMSIHFKYPYLIFEKDDKHFAFIYPGMGAPISGAVLEETIALGGDTILFFGSAGIFEKTTQSGELIIPSCGIRDEGTSFHYQAPDRYAYADSHIVSTIESVFRKNEIAFRTGLTWTTDAVYRETPSKIKRMQDENCLSVEMEASALFTIAKYHKKKIGGFFLPTDAISPLTWTPLKQKGNLPYWNPVQLLNIAIDILNTLLEE